VSNAIVHTGGQQIGAVGGIGDRIEFQASFQHVPGPLPAD
jgi:hypothetical protein